MKIFLITVVFILLISCKKEKIDSSFFQDSLYSEILKYQKKNPIPKDNLYKLFIYEIAFSHPKDTLLTITVSSIGVESKNSFGIYKNRVLKPSYLIDSQNLSKRFVNNYIKDNIESYIFEGEPPNIDLIYPVYKYKVQRNKLILIDSAR
ncbi:hypothetical protein [Epilithonimonas sp.]|uniref:hypothetical protein n=1 Tax=Epilithonimonas sp. TaxID=2894511 RepID=UPI00289EBDF5|nr:hypothetical protein [Epilithonimonas sp.]